MSVKFLTEEVVNAVTRQVSYSKHRMISKRSYLNSDKSVHFRHDSAAPALPKENMRILLKNKVLEVAEIGLASVA
jgi:hypothetical protein